jgi:hypothetical protein
LTRRWRLFRVQFGREFAEQVVEIALFDARAPRDLNPRAAAAWSLAAGISLFALSRRMGTSLAMIDATYGHLAPDAEEQEAALLDAFDARNYAAAEAER